MIVEQIFVPADRAGGVSTRGTLLEDVTYRLRVTGSYSYGSGRADAECSTAAGGTEWRRKAYDFGAESDHYDLWLNGSDHTFLPVGASVDRCSPQHVYEALWTPSRSGTLNLRLMTVTPAMASGGVTVDIRRV